MSIITNLSEFRIYLMREERSENTITCYMRDVKSFLIWLDKEPADMLEFDLFAYKLIKAGTPMTNIQQILGHESILTTNLYTQTTEQDKVEALTDLVW